MRVVCCLGLVDSWRGLGKTWSILKLFRYPDAWSRDKSQLQLQLATSLHGSRGPWSGTGEVGNAIVLFGIAYSRLSLMTTA